MQISNWGGGKGPNYSGPGGGNGRGGGNNGDDGNGEDDADEFRDPVFLFASLMYWKYGGKGKNKKYTGL